MSRMAQASEVRLRAMERKDWAEVADLIYVSTNYWYETHGRPAIFRGGPSATMLFCEVYESLDPGCCVVAESTATGRLMGSCFYHPRETHVSLGIMNVHPNYAGMGIARRLLNEITGIADSMKLPVRLISSALNVDSFSLYSRAGFTPRQLFQDMLVTVPAEGLLLETPVRVRDARPADLSAIAALERELTGIERARDHEYFLRNGSGCWHGSIAETEPGTVSGFLFSISHPASGLLGPGVARTDTDAIALVHAELNARRGRTQVTLVPADSRGLVDQMYRWGARNCELHVTQVRGDMPAARGVQLPTFMPESG